LYLSWQEMIWTNEFVLNTNEVSIATCFMRQRLGLLLVLLRRTINDILISCSYKGIWFDLLFGWRSLFDTGLLYLSCSSISLWYSLEINFLWTKIITQYIHILIHLTDQQFPHFINFGSQFWYIFLHRKRDSKHQVLWVWVYGSFCATTCFVLFLDGLEFGEYYTMNARVQECQRLVYFFDRQQQQQQMMIWIMRIPATPAAAPMTSYM